MEACTTARLAGRDLDERRLRQRHRRHRHHSRQHDSRAAGTLWLKHFRLLTEQQVHSLLPMPDLIAAMESALAKFSAREVLQPVRSVLTVGPTKAYFGLMPAYVPAPASLGAKLVTVFGENHKRTCPRTSPRSCCSIRKPARCRRSWTAATSPRRAPRRSRRCRRDSWRRPDASTLAIIGSGVQARSHLEAYQLVRQLKQVRIWSPKQRSREQFVDDMSAHVAVPIVAADSAEAAVRGADLIVLVTSSPTPVIDDAWVSTGAHVVCVGACRPNQREMPPALVARSRLYVDSRAAAVVESGDIVMNIADGLFDASHIRGEIGELVLGRIARPQVGRRHHGVQIARHGGRGCRRRRSRVSPRLGIRSRNGADVMNGDTPQPKKRNWIAIVLGVLFAVRHARRSAASWSPCRSSARTWQITETSEESRDAASWTRCAAASRASSR